MTSLQRAGKITNPIKMFFAYNLNLCSMRPLGIIQNSAERMILEKMEIEGDPTPRPLVVIDWLILLIKKTHKKGRFAEYKYYLQSVENVLAYKKNCGNTIKV
jgi:hypothetical protein